MFWEQGGRRFKSSHLDYLKQGLMAIALGPFLLWVTNEGQIRFNLPLPGGVMKLWCVERLLIT
jgi:hypothetical protein